jgi:phosphate-selective porin OprO/OprP
MKKTMVFAIATSLLVAHAAQAAPPDFEARIAALESEIALLKRQKELDDEAKKASAEKTPAVTYNEKGLSITSPDKNFQLRLRGYVQADTRTFFDNSNTDNVDTFLIRSARPIIESKIYDDFTARLMLDFGGGQTRLLDAFADYKADPIFNVRLGKFKAPIGLERWQSEQEILFVERGMATNLVPFRDIGVQFYGELLPQQLEYQLAFTNGTTDLDDPSRDLDDSKDVTARIFAHPFRNSEIVDLQGFGIGIAGSYGKRDGSVSNPIVTDGYRTPAQARFFRYRSGAAAADTAFADGTSWRINPQGYYYSGPFSLLAEYVLSSQEIRRGAVSDSLRHQAWTAVTTYVLTGEDASFDGVKPKRNFDFSAGTWGAFEVLARYGELVLDNDTFPLFADIARSSEEARDMTLGATWYLNNSIKLNANFSYTTFDGGATGGADREDEKVFLTRAQFRF